MTSRRRHSPSSIERRLPRTIFRLADTTSGGLIILVLVFSPWLFGGTTPWAITLINSAGYALGLLLVIKRITSLARSKEQRQNWRSRGSGYRRWMIRTLALLTALLVLYVLASALNARASFNPADYQFAYRDFIAWLPASFDQASTWQTMGTGLALISFFWAVRHWLLGERCGEQMMDHHSHDDTAEVAMGGNVLFKRLRLLIWVLAINSALLAAQGLAQRAGSATKLLWLVEPHINKAASAQFGPYAYRSNAAAYFLLVWPLILGLWWNLRRTSRTSSRKSPAKYANYLLPCLLLAASVPILSLSRAGLIIGSMAILVALAILLFCNRSGSRTMRYGITSVLAGALLLALATEWVALRGRLDNDSPDSGRMAIWESTWRIVQDYPVFGIGPGSYSSVYSLYRSRADDTWFAQAHNDWLETLATFGIAGSIPIVLSLVIVVALSLTGGGLPVDRIVGAMLWLSTGSCLLFAMVDFPLQIESIRLLFVLQCAILSAVSLKER